MSYSHKVNPNILGMSLKKTSPFAICTSKSHVVVEDSSFVVLSTTVFIVLLLSRC